MGSAREVKAETEEVKTVCSDGWDYGFTEMVLNDCVCTYACVWFVKFVNACHVCCMCTLYSIIEYNI